MKITTKLWIGILLLVLLSPLGLMLPEYFKAASDWSEDGRALWHAPFPDYSLRPLEEKGLLHLSFGYIISAILGIAIIVTVARLIGKKLTKKGD